MSIKFEDTKREILLDSGTNEVEFLTILIGGNPYAINVEKIRKLMEYPDNICFVPNLSKHIVGTFDYMGTCIPILSLDEHLHGSSTEIKKQFLAILEFNTVNIAICIDKAVKIDRISWTQFQPFEDKLRLTQSNSAVGTIKIRDKLIPVLDLETLSTNLLPDEYIGEDSITNRIAYEPQLEKLRILYCEDSKIVQKFTVQKFEEAGIKNVKICNNGQEAFNLLSNKKEINNYDAVITDIEMPWMDGLTLCRSLKQELGYNKIPVLFYSSIVTEQMKDKCQSVGGDGSYSKPEINHLLTKIKDIFIQQ